MTQEEFSKLQANLLKQVVNMSTTKGREYANNDSDRLANFKRAAWKTGITPMVVLSVYLDKHLGAIDSYIRHQRSFSTEGIEGRLVDAITYLTLLWGLITEQEEQEKGTDAASIFAKQVFDLRPAQTFTDALDQHSNAAEVGLGGHLVDRQQAKIGDLFNES